jgi:transcriptional regulator with XRE-family HTH domain
MEAQHAGLVDRFLRRQVPREQRRDGRIGGVGSLERISSKTRSRSPRCVACSTGDARRANFNKGRDIPRGGRAPKMTFGDDPEKEFEAPCPACGCRQVFTGVRRPAGARTRCFRDAVNAAGSGTTSSTFTRYLNRIGRSVRAGLYSPAFAGRWYLTPISRYFARRRDAFRSMKRICGIVPAMLAVNLPNAYRPPSGDNPALDAQQPRRNILAARIQVRLDRLGFTARAASIKAGLKPDAIRNIVRGKSENPRGDTLRSLARALECSVQYLVSGDDFTEIRRATIICRPIYRRSPCRPTSRSGQRREAAGISKKRF